MKMNVVEENEMRDLKRYWQEIRAIQHSLPESVWLVSLDFGAGSMAGQLVEVPAGPAARLLHAKSHRVADKGEIVDQQARDEAVKREREREALHRMGIAIVQV
jgi:hypothetical protein